ncbi:hypothetical protein [Neisseria sp. oral taxon 020]|uniref:hypothetical protein n=1 Tax=Neisseria sp. oral taxon 020 TaxID=712401 RepID=UPI0012EDB1A3|nr:hypothetical protein [Neisseria sp. oral taxon 020]
MAKNTACRVKNEKIPACRVKNARKGPTLLRFFLAFRAFFTQKPVSQAECQQPLASQNKKPTALLRLAVLLVLSAACCRSFHFDSL